MGQSRCVEVRAHKFPSFFFSLLLTKTNIWQGKHRDLLATRVKLGKVHDEHKSRPKKSRVFFMSTSFGVCRCHTRADGSVGRLVYWLMSVCRQDLSHMVHGADLSSNRWRTIGTWTCFRDWVRVRGGKERKEPIWTRTLQRKKKKSLRGWGDWVSSTIKHYADEYQTKQYFGEFTYLPCPCHQLLLINRVLECKCV